MSPARDPRRRPAIPSSEMSANESCVDDCEPALQRPPDCPFEFATPVLNRRRPCGLVLQVLTNMAAESFELFFRREVKPLCRHRRLRDWERRKRSYKSIYDLR